MSIFVTFLAMCTVKTKRKKKKSLAGFSKLLPPVALRVQGFELHLRCLLPAAGWFQAKAPGDAVLDSVCHSEMTGGSSPRAHPSGLLRKIPQCSCWNSRSCFYVTFCVPVSYL